MKMNNEIKRLNTRSKLLTKFGYEVWEIDDLTIKAANYAFDDNKESSIKEMKESIETYKTIIINSLLR